MPEAKSPIPKTRRGRETRERILAAAEALLADGLFERISVQDIVDAAAATVGSFYNLFGDKEDLLPALYERAAARTLRGLDRLLLPSSWKGAALADAVEALVGAVVRIYRKERGLMRALVLRSHCDPGAVDRPPGMAAVIPRIADLLGSFRDEIAHPRPKRAAAFGFLMVLATARERLLYPDTPASAVAVSERALAAALVRAYLAYLPTENG